MPELHPRDRIQFDNNLGSYRKSSANKLVVWILLVLEDWDISRPLPRQAVPQPLGKNLVPDVLNWTWHEYGMRAGFWRIKKILDDLEIMPSIPIGAKVIENYPAVADACLQSDWELVAHGVQQIPLHYEEDPMSRIIESKKHIQQFSGQDPLGWLGPGLAQTLSTPDMLIDAGYKYMLDWVLDDIPVWVEGESGKIAALPYNLEINDIPMVNVRHHETKYFREKTEAYAEQLMLELVDGPKFMSIALHPYLTGTPDRAAGLRQLLSKLREYDAVEFWSGRNIYNWFDNERDI